MAPTVGVPLCPRVQVMAVQRSSGVLFCPIAFGLPFAASCRRDRYSVFTIGTVRRPGKNSMKPCEIDFRLWDKRGQFCDEVQGIEYDVHGCTNVASAGCAGATTCVVPSL